MVGSDWALRVGPKMGFLWVGCLWLDYLDWSPFIVVGSNWALRVGLESFGLD